MGENHVGILISLTEKSLKPKEKFYSSLIYAFLKLSIIKFTIKNLNIHILKAGHVTIILAFSILAGTGSVVAGTGSEFCNPAIGGLGQSGCTWTVFQRSSSELRINVHIMLNDVDTHK